MKDDQEKETFKRKIIKRIKRAKICKKKGKIMRMTENKKRSG